MIVLLASLLKSRWKPVDASNSVVWDLTFRSKHESTNLGFAESWRMTEWYKLIDITCVLRLLRINLCALMVRFALYTRVTSVIGENSWLDGEHQQLTYVHRHTDNDRQLCVAVLELTLYTHISNGDIYESWLDTSGLPVYTRAMQSCAVRTYIHSQYAWLIMITLKSFSQLHLFGKNKKYRLSLEDEQK